MNGEIFAQLNRSYSFDDVVHLSEVTSKEKKARFEKEGYLVGFTAREWKKRFPALDAGKVVVPKTELFPPCLYYLDLERGVAFNLQVCNGQALYRPEMDDAERNQFYANNLQRLETARDAHDYNDILYPLSSEGSGNMVMPLLLSYIEKDAPSANLYDCFINYYTFCDCGSVQFQFKDFRLFEKLYSCKDEKQKKHTESKLAAFDDVISIYRGEGSQSTPYQRAISWTTDINQAYFFAGWRGGESARIISAKVRKPDVLEYISDRGESEIIVLPAKVTDISISSCIAMETFKQFISGGVAGFKTTSFLEYCASDLAARVKNVYSRFGVIADHDDEHSIRVCLFATFLFRMDVLSAMLGSSPHVEKSVKRVYDALMTACVWHDTGRSDNTPNDDHGLQSCEVFRCSNKPDKVVEFLMEYHCKSDASAKDYWCRHFSSDKNAKLVWAAYEIMKDADALDRCRFGNQCEDYVDVGFLRSETSKRLLPVAQTLQSYRIA